MILLLVSKFCLLLQRQKRHEVVSSSSLVRTSGFHPGNSGSNPGETTNQNPNPLKIKVRVFYLRQFCPTVSTTCQPMA